MRQMMIETFEGQRFVVTHDSAATYCWATEFPHFYADQVIAEIKTAYPKISARFDRFADGRVKVESRSLPRLLSLIGQFVNHTEA